jgi:hypothetical protein
MKSPNEAMENERQWPWLAVACASWLALGPTNWGMSIKLQGGSGGQPLDGGQDGSGAASKPFHPRF